MGDLNARTGNAPDYIINDNDKHLPLDDKYILDCATKPRASQDPTLDDRGKHLLEINIAAQMRILNGRKPGDSIGYFTSHQYNGSGVVDYAICSESLLGDIVSFKVHKFVGTLSDHCMISFTLKHYKHCPVKVPEAPLSPMPRMFKWNENSDLTFREALKLKPIQEKIALLPKLIKEAQNGEDINNVVQSLCSIYVDTGNFALKHKTAGVSRKCHKGKPWHDHNLKRMERDVKKKGHIMQQKPCGETRKAYFLSLKRFRKLRKYKRRHYLSSETQKLRDLQHENPKVFWQTLEKIKCQGNTKVNPADKISPGQWYDYLTELNNPTTANPNNQQQNLDLNLEEETMRKTFSKLDFPIHQDEVKRAIIKQKNGKACGLDSITNEMIKNSITSMLPCLSELMTRIYALGIYPDAWCKGYITCMHKKGSYTDPNNYRAITITSALSKIFNSVLNERLENYLDENNLISPLQIGFKKGASTSDHILTMKTLIDKYTHKPKQKLYTCFVDFKKAFDKVPHNELFGKLIKLDINNHFLRIIKSMYSKTKLCVRLQNSITDSFDSILAYVKVIH